MTKQNCRGKGTLFRRRDAMTKPQKSKSTKTEQSFVPPFFVVFSDAVLSRDFFSPTLFFFVRCYVFCCVQFSVLCRRFFFVSARTVERRPTNSFDACDRLMKIDRENGQIIPNLKTQPPIKMYRNIESQSARSYPQTSDLSTQY
jgi:hypothetical protein